jgi:hypothetical protein
VRRGQRVVQGRGAEQDEREAADGDAATQNRQPRDEAALREVDRPHIPAAAFERERQHEQEGKGSGGEDRQPRKNPVPRQSRGDEQQ